MRVLGVALVLFVLCSFLVSASAERRKNIDSVSACTASLPAELRSCAPYNSYPGRESDSDVVDALPMGSGQMRCKGCFSRLRVQRRYLFDSQCKLGVVLVLFFVSQRDM